MRLVGSIGKMFLKRNVRLNQPIHQPCHKGHMIPINWVWCQPLDITNEERATFG